MLNNRDRSSKSLNPQVGGIGLILKIKKRSKTLSMPSKKLIIN